MARYQSGPGNVRQIALPVGNDTTNITNVAVFYRVGMNTDNPTATEANHRTTVPTAGTVRSFTMRINATPTAGHTLTAVVRLNGVDTALTLSWTSADTAPSTKTITGAVAVVEGDELSVSMVKDTAGAQGFVPNGVVMLEPA